METITADEAQCPYCAETIKAEAIKCRYCGEYLDEQLRLARLTDHQHVANYQFSPGVAAVLSAIAPGMGQIYQGRISVGFGYIAVIGALIFFAGIFSIVFGLVALIIYMMNVFDAYNYKQAGSETNDVELD